MKLSHRIENTVCIVTTEGDFTKDQSQQLLSYAIGLLNTISPHALIVNMKETTKIDTSGLGVITALSKSAQKKQIGFGICQLTKPIYEVFDKTLFKKTVSIYDTEEIALASYENVGTN